MVRRFIILILVIPVCYGSAAQYISEVIEYRPAPGQFINTAPWGHPGSATSIIGGVNGTMCLGGFGGTVIFRFDGPVENHPDNPYGVDFTLFGNPLTDWSEPGIVSVMKDENENGLPDDRWYELAGSDYYFSSTIRNYEVTYFNPGDAGSRDVSWIDNMGGNGIIPANGIHAQSYYPLSDSFPSIPGDKYTLSGTLIRPEIDSSKSSALRSFKRAFGYADNQCRGVAPYTLPDNPYTQEIEHSGGDAFDIHWAVDHRGEYVDLERIDFVRVQNATNVQGGRLGELSTEITGAVDVQPEPSISGSLELIAIKGLPREVRIPEFQLDPLVFYRGRPQRGRSITWTTNMPEAAVDENHLVTVTRSGELILTASLTDNPEIVARVTTTVNLGHTAAMENQAGSPAPRMHPNPAGDVLYITGIPWPSMNAGEAKISLYDAAGRICREIPVHREDLPLDVAGIQAGLYMVRIDYGSAPKWLKLVKE